MPQRPTTPSDRDAPTLILDDSHSVRDAALAPEDRDAAPLRRGAQLEHYVVLDELGHGGMAVVYRAYDARLHREVALKVLRSRAPTDSAASARMLREARAMAQLAHPNVVPVFDAGTTNGRNWVAMELVQGHHLGDWLALGPHAVAAVVEVLHRAGQGLAAAHDKGLVHRDFKPANVMVGPGPRVRVTDFGLARVADGPLSTPPHLSAAAAGLAPSLTHHGTIVGTPAYMPPEQLDGAAVDARADQYAYCLTAWEALFGSRPFQGDPKTVQHAKREHVMREPAGGHSVPAALIAALRRGLSPAPADRFASMRELLGHVRLARSSREKALLIGASAVLVGGAVLGGRAVRAPDARCKSAQPQLDAIWSQTRADTIATAFAATRSPRAAATWTRAAAALDQYTQRWRTLAQQVCTATVIDGTQPQVIRELRQRCLDDRLRDVDVLLDVLQDADTTVVAGAAVAVSGLPQLSPCSDVQYLQARVAPPTNPDTARQVEVLAEGLRQVQAEEAAGRYDRGTERIELALAQARAVGYAPVVAQLLRRQGSLAMQQGRYADSEPLLREAFFTAAAVSADEVAVQAAIDLSFATLSSARLVQAQTWLQHAEMLTDASHLPASFSARRIDRLGVIRSKQRRDPEALALHQQAFDILQGEPTPNQIQLAGYEMHIAIALSDVKRNDEAAASYQRVIARYEALLGPEHPNLGIVLINLGSLRNDQERYDDAVETLSDAERIVVGALGTEHPYLASIHMTQAVAHAGLLRWDEAITLGRKAARIHAAALGPDHPQTADDLFNVGLLNHKAGRPRAAREALLESLAIQRRRLGANHPETLATVAAFADLDLAPPP